MRWFLREPRAMADHVLDQLMRHIETRRGPDAQSPIVATAGGRERGQPDQQRQQMQVSADTRRQDPAGEHQFHDRDDNSHAAAEYQRLQHLRFHHATDDLAGALMPHRVNVDAQRAGQQAPLQDTPEIEREGRLEPASGEPQRDAR